MKKPRPPETQASAAVQPEERTRLEDALQRLEGIAARLETGSLPLEEALELYREARALHAVCVERLTEAERELQVLMTNGELRAEGARGDGDAGAED
jgi:exodeoxyribonuclease VII small subunit